MNSSFCDGIKDPEFSPLVSAGPLSRWVREAALGMHYHLIEQLSANNGKQKADDSEEGDGGGKEVVKARRRVAKERERTWFP